MVRIALCDDLEEIRRQTKECLIRYFMPSNYEFQVDEYCTGELLLDAQERYDLISLDYQFDNSEMDGLSIASAIRERGDEAKIIFLSGYPEVVFGTFRFDTFRFIVKPVDDEIIKEAMDAFIHEETRDRHICFSSSGNEYFVRAKDIVYVESKGKYCMIHRDKEQNNIILRRSLRDIAGNLVDDCFFRCHNSYIVNFRYVSECTRSEIKLTDGSKIPMSRRRYSDFMFLYGTYLLQNR